MPNSPARVAIDVGTVIDGTYTVEALIGKGGMGAVFLASHARLPGKYVAIKVLHTDLEDSDEVTLRFEREAKIATQLNHPNIVEVHDFKTLPDGTPYVILEYLEGESLAARIKRGPIDFDDAMPIVRQVGAALHAAHAQGIVHRDLKPHNVFLVPTQVGGATIEQVKVLDFGISKIRGSNTVKTQEKTMLGTPQYMAPEQATGKHDSVDGRSDLFSLGAMVYEMLCGAPAFAGASIPEVVFKVVYEDPPPLEARVPGLSPERAAVIHKAMAKQPDARFATVDDFIEALTGEKLVGLHSAAMISRPPGPRTRNTSGPSAPGTGSESGKRKVTTDDALANTVGSAPHGDPPIAIAETVASGSREALPVAGLAGVPPGQPVSRRALGIAVAAVAAIAIVVVAIVFTGRGGGTHAIADAAIVAVVASDAPVAVPVATDATIVAVAVDAATADAARAATRPDARPKKPEDDETDPTPPPELAADVARAKEIIRGDVGDLIAADRLGKKLARARNPQIRAIGTLVMGLVACEKKDVGRARTAYDRLGKGRRARLAAACAKNKIYF